MFDVRLFETENSVFKFDNPKMNTFNVQKLMFESISMFNTIVFTSFQNQKANLTILK